MKWKSVLTLHEASLIGANLAGYTSFSDVEKAIEQAQLDIEDCYDEYDRESDMGLTVEGMVHVMVSFRKDRESLMNRFQNAKEILQSLISDVEAVIEGTLVSSPLEIAILEKTDSSNLRVSGNTLCTKFGYAKWFFLHDPEIARKFYPAITADVAEQTRVRPFSSPKKEQLSPKAENYLCNTVAVLAGALIGGLSGKPFADAESIALALFNAGLEEPVCTKKMAEYLKKAV